ncbi:MAG: tRNA pseudouridine(38-40) synthase TruA [Clostridia bacterium]|nr:tRNA pseudouridine(38-40) synthase TruA [Clostridia bacterium]
MKNYKITISYDGTKYNGWQRQGNTKNTLQEKFENVLSKMCGKQIEIFASGRTDAGVHALGQVANFKCETDKNPDEIMVYLNAYLPEDVAVLDIEEVQDMFHSRLCAKRKTYRYTIACTKKHVFARKFVYRTDEVLSVDAMRQAANKLRGTHDFIGFSAVKKIKKSTVRTIYDIDIRQNDGLIEIDIIGSGFLHHMVRIIAGTLFDIGCGRMTASVIDEVLENGVRSEAGTMLPACGLMLLEVEYK